MSSKEMSGISDSLKDFFKMDFNSIIKERVNSKTVGDALLSQLHSAGDLLSQDCFQECLDVCEVVTDFVWEKLNQGHWKDVSVDWRYIYTIISAMKALSLYAVVVSEEYVQKKLTGVFAETKASDEFSKVMKTCDMGLLMGAPVLDNILSRLSTALQSDFNLKFSSTSFDDSSGIESDSDDLSKRKAEDEYFDDSSKKIKVDDELLVRNISEDKCIERVSCPSLETFTRDYLSTQTPVIITDAMNGWPALSNRKWSLDYIKKMAGCRTVPVELGLRYTDDTWSQKLMTVQEFIEKYIEQKTVNTEVGYLAQHQLFNQIPELQNDLIIPDYCYLGNSEDVDINAWFGPQGTVSPLHYDPKHNFLSQVIGEKYIRIYPASETAKLYPHDSTLLKNTSQVDLENPDHSNFPLFSQAKYMECVLRSGEMLYMPPKFWHFVKSLSISFSVSFWWE